jgi:hypothetical protein
MTEIVRYEEKEFCGRMIRMREDGYLNGTDMCKANGKQYGDYIRLEQTKEFLKELSTSKGYPLDQLICKIMKGSNDVRGTWVHPHVAIHLAQWLSPKFSVKVTDWVFKFMTGEMREPLIDKRSQVLMQAKLDESLRELEKNSIELDRLRQVNMQLNNYVSNVKQRLKEEIIYIATTRRYAAENKFKVGGCESKKLLKKRLSQYNTGRTSDDLYYYAYISSTNSYTKLESRIKDVLVDFIESKNKEMYVLHYDCLKSIIELIREDYNREIDHINKIIRNITDNFLNKQPSIPNAISLNDELQIEYKTDGVVEKTLTIEVKNTNIDEIHLKIQEFVDLCAKKIDEQYEFVKDKDNKQMMLKWVDILDHLKTFRRWKSAEWKKVFIEFYNKTRPLCLNVKGIGLPLIE